MKVRFIEPGNQPYRKSLENYMVYDKYIRTPSNGILILATILKQEIEDVFCYSESISKIVWEDVLDADLIFISIFTFNATRGYALADYIRQHSTAVIAFGGLHATLNSAEAILHGDYVLRGEGDETILPFAQAIQQKTIPDIPGVVYRQNGEIRTTGDPVIPQAIDTIPNRHLLYRFHEMAGHSTLWPQVHASRGCPHNCDYCALVAAFGRCIRVRSPQSVVEDIRQAIDFFDIGHHRMAKILWITDDNFFANREWALSVLDAIINSGIHYSFTVQARYEVGFDDEMLERLKQAGFVELAMGIEFLEDEAFRNYHKKSTYAEILRSVKNIQKHGLRVRGLFIFGADNHTPGIGNRLADFVIQNDICGVLIQSMYFIPGTPVYEAHRDSLIVPIDWARCIGKVVHYPQNMTPAQLQREIILASRKIYSFRRLFAAVLYKRGIERTLFMGEFLWQFWVRKDLKKELPYLESLPDKAAPVSAAESAKHAF